MNEFRRRILTTINPESSNFLDGGGSSQMYVPNKTGLK